MDRAQIEKAFSEVCDPESGRDLLTLGVIRDVECSPDHIRISVSTANLSEAVEKNLRSDISRAIRKVAAESGYRRIPEIELEFPL